MGIQILNKDVSIISNVMGKLKASIGSIFGTTGWAGGGGGGGGGGTPASQGPLAGTPPATNNTSVGFRAWSSGLANLFSTSSYSECMIASFDANARTNYIVGQGFGFSIPTGATINGIVVTLQFARYDPGGSTSARDYSVKIVKNNTITGNDKFTLAEHASSTPTNKTYGSSTDLWGETWTAADINNSNFGLAYSVELTSYSKGTMYLQVRNLRITVHYTS